MTMSSGVPALQVAYGAALTVDQVDDPGERAAALTSGEVVAALFRRTEVTDLDGLVELDDPIQVLTPDPLVVAVSSQFAEQRPDAVLVLEAVQTALDEDAYAELVAAAAADGLEPAIAEWLKARRLA
jgi:glycine betaine/choline ABC-type transport system substrate-binding protein